MISVNNTISRRGRRGFILVSAVTVCFIIMSMAAYLCAYYTKIARVEADADVSYSVIRREAARVGIDEAEDWILSEAEAGFAPSAGGAAWAESDPLRAIEARSASGARFRPSSATEALGVSVFIADADYDISIFPDSRPPYAIPVMPAEVLENESGRNISRRRYFLRSLSDYGESPVAFVFEELLCVDIDADFGGLAGARRVFIRGLSEQTAR